jgi:hypothetical protein
MNHGPLPSIEERIARKLEVLREWTQNGVPVEHLGSMPRSLRDARTWEDVKLNVYKIGSPNEFVKTHDRWGESLVQIERCIFDLVEAYRVNRVLPKKSRKVEKPANEVELISLREQMRNLVRQWNEAREEADSWKGKAVSAERRLSRTKTALAEARAEISRLKSAQRQRLHLRLVQ